MTSKTYKIGERATYGIWRVIISKQKIMLQGINFDTKRIEDTTTFNIPSNSTDKDDLVSKIRTYLLEQMDYFHADKIIDFIESKLYKKIE